MNSETFRSMMAMIHILCGTGEEIAHMILASFQMGVYISMKAFLVGEWVGFSAHEIQLMNQHRFRLDALEEREGGVRRWAVDRLLNRNCYCLMCRR